MKYKIVCDKHEFEFENKINFLLEQAGDSMAKLS